MSIGLMPYLISRDDVATFLGSKDDDFKEQILEECADELAQIDELCGGGGDDDDDDDGDDDDEGEGLSATQAVAEIIDGELTTAGYNVYAAVYEVIIRNYLGDLLNNGCFCPTHWEGIAEVDARLRKMGLDLEVASLASSPGPLPLPENPETGMDVGYWEAEQMRRNLAVLVACPTLPEKGELAEAVAEIRGWLERAVGMPNPLIVGFCY